MGQSLTSLAQVHADKMRKALTMDMLATDLADYLVRKGVSSAVAGTFELIVTNYGRSRSAKPTTYRGGQSHLQSRGSVRCTS